MEVLNLTSIKYGIDISLYVHENNLTLPIGKDPYNYLLGYDVP